MMHRRSSMITNVKLSVKTYTQYQNSFWSQIVNSISTKINQKRNRYITESLAFQFESKLSRFEVNVTVHHEATDELIHAFSCV